MQNLPGGATPQTDSYLHDLQVFDGEQYVPLNDKVGHVLRVNDQANGRWYTIQFDEAFIREHGDGLKLGFEGMVVDLFPQTEPGAYSLALLRPGLFLDGIRLAQLHPHQDSDTELYRFGYGAVWSDWIDSPALARRQYAHRLRQHIAETGRPY